jgi:hypothetical protein
MTDQVQQIPKYQLYFLLSDILSCIFKPVEVNNRKHLSKIIQENAELTNEKNVVPYGFRYHGDVYINPSLTFSPDRKHLTFLHKTLEPKIEDYISKNKRVEEDRDSISKFISLCCFGSKNNEEALNKLPIAFDVYIKKILPKFTRTNNNPEINDRLINLYEEILPKLKMYSIMEIIV